jgi:hypothetical protein
METFQEKAREKKSSEESSCDFVSFVVYEFTTPL